MKDEKKPITVAIDPACLEEMEKTMSPEEVQDLLNEIKKMADDGSLFEQLEPIDMNKLAIEDPEFHQQLIERQDDIAQTAPSFPTSRTLH